MAGAGETTSLEPGDDIYGYNSYYGTLVDVEIEPGSSLLALLWLPPSLIKASLRALTTSKFGGVQKHVLARSLILGF
jgi:hypothetical protein